MASKGDNSLHGNQLKSVVARIENLNEEIKALQGDRKDVYSEAKGSGFDVKVLRKLIQRRAMDAAARDEQHALLELYEGVFS